MALFTVQPETLWPHGYARVTVSVMALERESPTVKQVTIPVHGANHNRAPRRTFLHRVPRRPVDGVQPALGLGGACSNAGHARPALRRGSAGPATEPHGSTTTRLVMAIPP